MAKKIPQPHPVSMPAIIAELEKRLEKHPNPALSSGLAIYNTIERLSASKGTEEYASEALALRVSVNGMQNYHSFMKYCFERMARPYVDFPENMADLDDFLKRDAEWVKPKPRPSDHRLLK